MGILSLVTIPLALVQTLKFLVCNPDTDTTVVVNLNSSNMVTASSFDFCSFGGKGMGDALGDILAIVCIIVALWSSLFVEFWKRKEAELLCRWDSLTTIKSEIELSSSQTKSRTEYLADEKYDLRTKKLVKLPSPITTKVFMWMFSGWMFILFAVILVVSVFITLTALKQSVLLANIILSSPAFVSVYHLFSHSATVYTGDIWAGFSNQSWSFEQIFGSGEGIDDQTKVMAEELDVRLPSVRTYAELLLSIVASTINGTFIAIMNQIYWYVAVKFTDFEHHRTEKQYQNALIRKAFVLQFINSYISIVANILMGVKADTIFIQVMMLLLTKVGLGLLTEQILPFLLRCVKKTNFDEEESLDSIDVTEFEEYQTEYAHHFDKPQNSSFKELFRPVIKNMELKFWDKNDYVRYNFHCQLCICVYDRSHYSLFIIQLEITLN